MQSTRPTIVKRGTIDCDLVEITPIVFRDRLYRLESVRAGYRNNTLGVPHFRYVDVEAGAASPPFGAGHHLGCAFTDGDTLYTYGVPEWGASHIQVFWTTDLKHWEDQTALSMPGWGLYNTSVCKGPDGYTMAFEIGEPPEHAGCRFTMYFAFSSDLRNWKAAPLDCVYSKDKYTACPALRYYGGFYYMVYLEHCTPDWFFHPHIIRSTDLRRWESSPLNPVITPSDEDRLLARDGFSTEEREAIAHARDVNNSDVDLCTWQGKTIVNYSWGDQEGVEFLAEAVFDGDERTLLEGFFPEDTD